MSWGSKTQISTNQTVNSTTLGGSSSSVTLNPGETAHVQVDCNFGTTPPNMEVHVMTTLDDSSETWDLSAYGFPFVILNSLDPNTISFLVSGVYKFKLMYKNSTGTVSNTLNAWVRTDGVSL